MEAPPTAACPSQHAHTHIHTLSASQLSQITEQQTPPSFIHLVSLLSHFLLVARRRNLTDHQTHTQRKL